jgi:hypothetical protein
MTGQTFGIGHFIPEIVALGTIAHPFQLGMRS